MVGLIHTGMVRSVSVTFRVRESLLSKIDEIIDESGLFTGRADFVAFFARVYLMYLELNTRSKEDAKTEEEKGHPLYALSKYIVMDELSFKRYTEGPFIPVNVRLPEGLHSAILGFGVVTKSFDNIQVYLRACVGFGINDVNTEFMKTVQAMSSINKKYEDGTLDY